jgi:hypothetical protein
MVEPAARPARAGRLSRLRRRWETAELLMLAGGSLACAASMASRSPATAVAVAPAGLTAALVAWRMRHLGGRRRLRAFYACVVGVLGITTAGQGYLRLAIGTAGWRATDGAWLIVAAGIVTLVGAGGRLLLPCPPHRNADAVTAAARSRYTRSG